MVVAKAVEAAKLRSSVGRSSVRWPLQGLVEIRLQMMGQAADLKPITVDEPLIQVDHSERLAEHRLVARVLFEFQEPSLRAPICSSVSSR